VSARFEGRHWETRYNFSSISSSIEMPPKYVKVIPSLPVTSVPKAIEYYCDVLGFRVAGRDWDDHTWLQLVTHEDEDKYNAPVNVYLRSVSLCIPFLKCSAAGIDMRN
jgi:hypothetical protein